jgi:hypothetical protein
MASSLTKKKRMGGMLYLGIHPKNNKKNIDEVTCRCCCCWFFVLSSCSSTCKLLSGRFFLSLHHLFFFHSFILILPFSFLVSFRPAVEDGHSPSDHEGEYMLAINGHCVWWRTVCFVSGRSRRGESHKNCTTQLLLHYVERELQLGHFVWDGKNIYKTCPIDDGSPTLLFISIFNASFFLLLALNLHSVIRFNANSAIPFVIINSQTGFLLLFFFSFWVLFSYSYIISLPDVEKGIKCLEAFQTCD